MKDLWAYEFEIVKCLPATGEKAVIDEPLINQKLKVLLVENDEEDYVLTRGLFRGINSSKFELAWAASYQDALESINRFAPDVCLIDYHLGENTGLELLCEIRRRGHKTPAILLAAQKDHGIDIKAMQAGAADYLIKEQIDRPLLERSIRYAINHARTLEALRASENRYRQIVETTAEGVWVLDGEAHTSYVNCRMAAMLGYTVEEMLALPAFDFMDASESAAMAERYERRRQGIAEQYECRLRRRDGSDLWVVVSASAIRDANGEFSGSLSMVTDITERKRAEKGAGKGA